MNDSQAEIRELKRVIEELLSRVSRLEELVRPGGGEGAGDTHGRGPARLEIVRPGSGSAAERNAARGAEIEARIGSQWLNRIGIAALLIGISYFLKFAFDNNWIGPATQVLIGMCAGVAVVAWSEWFRVRGYRAFSYSLKAVGIGALYLSLWAAFQIYSLITVGAAFSGMVAVTAATAAFALLQNAELLAAFALAGGFATPVLLSTGHNREAQLFVYLALLDLAALGMLLFRNWRLLLVLSFAGTVALYFAWYAEYYSAPEFGVSFAFATLFFTIFMVATLLRHSGPELRFPRSVLLIASVNAAAYFLAVSLMLQTGPGRAWFAAALAAVYLMLARTGRAPSQLRAAHLALAVAFITIALALRLNEVWISVGWFVEAALLMAAGFWRQSAFVRWLALALITATTLKVFAYDIWDLSRGYRIVSFVFLGVLLLAVSFAYQRDWLKLASGGPARRQTSEM